MPRRDRLGGITRRMFHYGAADIEEQNGKDAAESVEGFVLSMILEKREKELADNNISSRQTSSTEFDDDSLETWRALLLRKVNDRSAAALRR